MQLLSTLVLLAITIQCAVAAPERNLLRSGYDKPINFADLPGLTTVAGNPTSHQQPTGGDHLNFADPVFPGKKTGLLPSSKSLPVGDSNLLSSALGGASPSTTSGTKAYPSLITEDRSLTSPKKTPPPGFGKQNVHVSPSKKTSPKTPPKKLSKKNSHTPNQKKVKVDPAKSPVQRPVV